MISFGTLAKPKNFRTLASASQRNRFVCQWDARHRAYQECEDARTRKTCVARVDGGTYLVFLQEAFSFLLQIVPANIKARMWFQLDGASAHFSVDLRNALGTAYPGRWIERGGPVNWPARLSVLSCLDSPLGQYEKSCLSQFPRLRHCHHMRRYSGEARGIC
ncbi:uncharacterized protein TNCV_3790051 [Trichonephila clavipes]|nr:uncharacterized protein TNCV_3790051 [Trichonephila clavipes]